jgi:glyoxylate/hydroxypyruvate reductase A
MSILFYSTIDDPAEWLPRLQAHLPGETIRLWPDIGDPAAVDVAVLWTQPPEGLGALTGLKAVQSLGAGVNQLSLGTVSPAIRVARLVDPGLSDDMAEYCLLATLRYFRRFDLHERAQRVGEWSFRLPQDRAGYEVGIMGLGTLGAAVAARLAANGFPVRGWTRLPREVEGVRCFAGATELDAFLDGLKVVICLLPLTAETTSILNARLFARLDGAYLINVGRGAHLVDDDLVQALEAGRLAGATLDVFHSEPPPADHPFWSHSHILMTPHVASAGDPATATAIVAENIHRAQAGAPMLYEVDRARGY